MPFRLKAENKVREPVRVMLAHLLAQAAKLFQVPDTIEVRALYRKYVVHPDHGHCDGLFWYPDEDEDFTPYITLACHHENKLEAISHIAWHELRHAPQWYAGKIHEDGVTRDAEVNHRDFMAWMRFHQLWPKE
jgi:hypothetical protein